MSDKSTVARERFILALLLIIILGMGGCIFFSEDPPRPEFHGSIM